MGKAGRIACIFLPFGLTVASLVCIVLVALGGTNKSSSTLSNLYFFEADLSNFTVDATSLTGSSSANSQLTAALQSAKDALSIKDYYTIYLWNYCDGDGNFSSTNQTFCSGRKASFYFNPIDVWGLNSTGTEDLFPTSLRDGLKVYKKVSHWMFLLYIIALVVTAAELVVSVFAVCSRWGSFFTTLFSSVSSFFILAASLTSTILFSTLVGTLNEALKPYNIHAHLGHNIFITTWLAVAFSWVSGLFWFFSVCCCSGRSPYHKDADRSGGFAGAMYGNESRRVRVEKTPYTYERVNEPFLGVQQSGVAGHPAYGPTHTPENVPMINFQAASPIKTQHPAYEPFRHN